MRTARQLKHNGETRTIKQWAERLGIAETTLRLRLHNKWTTTKALNTPVDSQRGAAPTHGMTGTKEYRAWQSMKFRCQNPNHKRWHCYGGKGINVCERWRKCFSTFYQDVGPAPSPEHTLGRLDHDRDYEPNNVAWQTMEEQVECWCKNNGSMKRRRK